MMLEGARRGASLLKGETGKQFPSLPTPPPPPHSMANPALLGEECKGGVSKFLLPFPWTNFVLPFLSAPVRTPCALLTPPH